MSYFSHTSVIRVLPGFILHEFERVVVHAWFAGAVIHFCKIAIKVRFIGVVIHIDPKFLISRKGDQI